MRLVRRQGDSARFDDLLRPLLADCICLLPVSRLGRVYYGATLSPEREELSFALVDGEQTLTACVCDVENGFLGRFGMAAELLYWHGADLSTIRRAIREAIGEIKRIASDLGVHSIRLLTRSPGREPDPMSGALMTAGFEASAHFRAVIDLKEDIGGIRANMRKGHRQQIRWGEANLRIRIVDKSSPSEVDFKSFRDLHHVVAGRLTRGDASWQAMFDAIISGEGRLVLSELDGTLVGGTLVLDGDNTAFYASGAYKRELFDKPLAHYPLVVAIERSAAAGLSWFDIGEVSLSRQASSKERSIAFFKRGFTSRLKAGLLWEWPGAGDVNSK